MSMPIMTRKDTVVLLFTRSAEEEASWKDFLRQKHARTNRRIAAALISKATSAVTHSGLPFIIIHSAQQQGDGFGERFANAFQSAFDLGYQKVIAVGSDVPGLDAATLRQAAQALQEAPVVLGPSPDGGAYLIGIEQSYFQAQHFSALPWQTPAVLVALITMAAAMGAATRLLHSERDIDRAQDLETAVRGQRNQPWYHLLRSWLSGLAAPINMLQHAVIPLRLTHSLHFRGPPVIA
jgi:glycosyltransferase A (GT-A) superfamily protein (DUF2064 family)